MKQITLGSCNVGFEIRAAVQYPNPKDDYLFTVLGFNLDKMEHVIWTYNAQDGGFYHGHYFRNRDAAYEYLLEKVTGIMRSYFGDGFLRD